MRRKRCSYGMPVTVQETLDRNVLNNDIARAEAESGWWNPALATAGALLGAGMQSANEMLKNRREQPLLAAYGIPVEVEGGEVAELPNGETIGFNGPTHEGGGIDMNLPVNTKVYSDRISVNGETLSERKVRRERIKKRYNNIEKRNGGDMLSRNTRKRINDILDVEDAIDMNLETNIRNAIEQTQRMGCGGRVKARYGLDYPYKKQRGYDKGASVESEDNVTLTPHDTLGIQTYFPIQSGGFIGIQTDFSKDTDNNIINYHELKPITVTPKQKSDRLGKLKSAIGDIDINQTPGNILGVAGNIAQAWLPYMNTLENRAGDAVNTNPYKGYGLEAIREQMAAEDLYSLLRDKSVRNAEMTRRNTMLAGTNRATGAAQNAAIAIAAQQAKNAAVDNATKEYISAVAGNRQHLASLLADRDARVMSGDEKVADLNKRDRDAFYTARGRDLASIGRGLTSVGSLINRSLENEQTMNLLRQKLNLMGLDIDKDFNIIKLTD